MENAGLKSAFADAISVDEVKIFKPSPRVYELASRHLNVPQNAIGFISSNFWDIAGAKSFGLWTCWINRAKASEEELGFRPDAIIGNLAELQEHLLNPPRINADEHGSPMQPQSAFIRVNPRRMKLSIFPPSTRCAFPETPRCLPARRRPWNSSP